MKQQNRLYLIIYVAALLMLSGQLITGCSSTSALKEDEQLFTGLVPIEYKNYEKGAYADSTITEMEYALASAPNGALFGSSYYRTPFPVRLWIWNAFSQSDGALAKWITKVFGSKPKLMANVNPQLRAQVAEHQLDKYGYFNGKVTYDVLTQSNPKKAKVAYQGESFQCRQHGIGTSAYHPSVPQQGLLFLSEQLCFLSCRYRECARQGAVAADDGRQRG